MSILRYAMLSVVIMLVIMAGAWMVRNTVLPPGSIGFVLGAIALSGVSGIIAYGILYSNAETRITLFVTYVSGVMMLKMVVGLLATFLVAFKFKDYAVPFVLSYFFCYFIFTSLEVYWLMRKLRPISKNGRRDTQDEEPNT